MFKSLRVSCVLLFFLCVSNLSWATKPVIAVFNLRPTSIDAIDYAGEILYDLVSVFTKKSIIQIMPRREMEEILLQQGLVQSDNPKQALEAGEVLGVNYVFTGQVSKQDSQIKAKFFLLSVPHKKIIKIWTLSFTGREDIFNKISQLAKSIEQLLSADQSGVKDNQHGVHIQNQELKIEIKNLKATCKKDYIILTWDFDPEDPISQFNIYRAECKNGPWQFVGKTNKNIFEDHQILKGHVYYMVAALLYNGQIVKLKPIVEVQNCGEKIPHPPIILEAKGFVKRIYLKFIPSLLNVQEGFEVKKYILYRKKENWIKVQEIPAEFNSPSELSLYAEDTGLQDNTTYEYCLTSVTPQKESPCSTPIKITTIPPPVLALEKDNLLRRIDLKWQKIDNVQGYYLYRRIQDEKWHKIASIPNNSICTYSDKNNLEDGLTYEYYLTAYDTKGETGPSNIVRGKTKDLPLPPTNIIAISGMVKSVLLRWNPINDKDVGGYIIYRGTTPNQMTEITKLKGHTKDSYIDKGSLLEPLQDGKTYYYAIASFNLYNKEGPISKVVKATTKPRPTSVKEFKAILETNKVILTWLSNPEHDIHSYIIYRCNKNGNCKKLATLPPTQTKYEDYEITGENVYTYNIIAIDKDKLKSDPAVTKVTVPKDNEEAGQ